MASLAQLDTCGRSGGTAALRGDASYSVMPPTVDCALPVRCSPPPCCSPPRCPSAARLRRRALRPPPPEASAWRDASSISAVTRETMTAR